MDSSIFIILIVFLWVVPIFAAGYFGAEKGRTIEGLALGAAFGVFGVIVIASLEPKWVRLEKQVETIRTQTSDLDSVELQTCRCSFCLSSIPCVATACAACGRDVTQDIEAEADDSNAIVSLAIDQIVSSRSDSGGLVMIVEPNMVTISVCTDSCEVAAHELELSVEDARQMLIEFGFVNSLMDVERIDTSNGNQIKIHFVENQTRDQDSSTLEMINVDWTSSFSIASHVPGEEPADYWHGVLSLTGPQTEQSSDAYTFKRALGKCADVASLWGANEITNDQAQRLLAAIGTIRTE